MRTRPPRALAFALAAGLGLLISLILAWPRHGVADEMLVEPTVNATGQAGLDVLAVSVGAVVLDSASRLHGIHISVPAAPGMPTPDRTRVLRSRLILWNGAPEVALTMLRAGTDTVLWARFAVGPAPALARHVSEAIAGISAISKP